MKHTLLLFALLLSQATFSQQFSATFDTLQTSASESKIILELSGPLSDLLSFTVIHSSVMGQDTVAVFSGTFNMDESDPSDFLSFELNEAQNKILLGTGVYEYTGFLTTINIVRREENATQAIIIN